MYKKLSLSIALYGLLITPLSPLGVYESYNIVDFVNRNFKTDDQSKPNLVSDFETHYPLSYQSPNILTNIEGAPNLDTQRVEKVERVEKLPRSLLPQSLLPQYVIEVSQSPLGVVPLTKGVPLNEESMHECMETIYIVREVREMK